MNNRPIYLVDDDIDDNLIVNIVWQELGIENELKFFTNGNDLIDCLQNDPLIPFIIICDLNLPLLNGFQIRERLCGNSETRYKTVPFIFWFDSASPEQVKEAYDLGVHGMFIKGSSVDELKRTFTNIIEYCQTTLQPA